MLFWGHGAGEIENSGDGDLDMMKSVFEAEVISACEVGF